MMDAPSRQKRPRPYLRSGIHTLKKAILSRALPSPQTALGRELHAWRASLIADLGGEETISTQQRALIDLACRSKLLVDSVDAFLLGMGSLVNKRRRALYPIVRERQYLVSQLQSLLRDLGLERRAKHLDLAAQLAALHRSSDTPPSVKSVESVPEAAPASSSLE